MLLWLAPKKLPMEPRRSRGYGDAMKSIRLGSVLLPPVTAIILAVLLVFFIVAGVVVNFVPSLASVVSYLPVTPAVLDGQVWRLLTYALLHDLGDPLHLLMNGFMIFMFGRELETRWGSGRYGLFALLTVLAGGVFVVLTGLILGGAGSAIGASAFAEGLIVAWGLTYRERPMRLFFAVEVKGIHMVYFAVFLWLLQAVSTSPTSASAHLGGMLMAALLVLGVWRPNAVKAGWWSLLERLGLKKKPKLYVVPGPSRPDDKKWIN
jgi:membrane associated rhomboid family serine protease